MRRLAATFTLIWLTFFPNLKQTENDLDILTLNSNSNPPSLVLTSSTNKAYEDYDPESTDFSI